MGPREHVDVSEDAFSANVRKNFEQSKSIKGGTKSLGSSNFPRGCGRGPVVEKD